MVESLSIEINIWFFYGVRHFDVTGEKKDNSRTISFSSGDLVRRWIEKHSVNLRKIL